MAGLKRLSLHLKIVRYGCNGLGYKIIPGDSESEYLDGRMDCRGCHDCKPDEYTKGHYKRRPKPNKEDSNGKG